MFEIIEYILQRSEGQLPLENSEIDKIFSIFITKRVSNVEAEMLFDLITRAEKNSRGYQTDDYLINDKKIRRYIFSTCLCKKSFVNPNDYSTKSIRCFKDLFLNVNEKESKLVLDRNDSIIKEVKSLNLEGLEALWEIARESVNPIVQERAGYLLSIIHYLYMDKKDPKLWGKETNLVVKDLMELLQAKTTDSIIQLNTIK